ncbi:hypothetical protein ACFWR9_11585 [Streptomyces sp. NPDC058534]|uniref:hypothetical protein n=1 Tax=Streptomyces sp. NPDC058534 TaxID=3346541 RepID=UPI00364E0D68
MGISHVSTGAGVGHEDTITPGYGSGATAGRLAVLQVTSGHADDAVPSTPSGWTRVGTFSGGGGTFASGAGPRRLTWFVRVLDGGDAAPTTSIPAGSTGSVLSGRIWVLERSAGTGWLWSASFGEDTSSGTGFSAACADTVTWRPGDFAILGYAAPNTSAGVSAHTVTATGVTFGSVTESGDGGQLSGYGVRNAQAYCSVTSGAAAQAPTVLATLSAASPGAAGVLRLREDVPKGVITLTEQSVFPPRIQIVVSELLAGDVATASLYRNVGSDRTALRGAVGIDATGQTAIVRVDAEQPFGVPVTYTARLVDSLGDENEVTSEAITSVVDSDVISDAVRGVGASVTLQTYPEKQRNRDATVFNVGGRMVVVSRKRSGPSGQITLRTLTDEAGDALNATLEDATEGIVLIRKAVHTPRLDGHYAVPQDAEAPRWFDEITFWTLDVVKVEAWPDVLEAAGFTLEDLAANFSTLQDLADFFTPGNLLDIAIYDFGG